MGQRAVLQLGPACGWLRSYSDLGANYFLERQTGEAYKHRLVRQLERMGHKLTLEPADDAA